MLGALLLHDFSQYALALPDIAAPIIGAVVIILIVVVLVFLLFKWYQFMVKRGVKEYVERYGGEPPPEEEPEQTAV